MMYKPDDNDPWPDEDITFEWLGTRTKGKFHYSMGPSWVISVQRPGTTPMRRAILTRDIRYWEKG